MKGRLKRIRGAKIVWASYGGKWNALSDNMITKIRKLKPPISSGKIYNFHCYSTTHDELYIWKNVGKTRYRVTVIIPQKNIDYVEFDDYLKTLEML